MTTELLISCLCVATVDETVEWVCAHVVMWCISNCTYLSISYDGGIGQQKVYLSKWHLLKIVLTTKTKKQTKQNKRTFFH